MASVLGSGVVAREWHGAREWRRCEGVASVLGSGVVIGSGVVRPKMCGCGHKITRDLYAHL